ncbi:hypothetical protein ACFQY4_32995 [Catellatospora bangladeshensis]
MSSPAEPDKAGTAAHAVPAGPGTPDGVAAQAVPAGPGATAGAALDADPAVAVAELAGQREPF